MVAARKKRRVLFTSGKLGVKGALGYGSNVLGGKRKVGGKKRASRNGARRKKHVIGHVIVVHGDDSDPEVGAPCAPLPDTGGVKPKAASEKKKKKKTAKVSKKKKKGEGGSKKKVLSAEEKEARKAAQAARVLKKRQAKALENSKRELFVGSGGQARLSKYFGAHATPPCSPERANSVRRLIAARIHLTRSVKQGKFHQYQCQAKPGGGWLVCTGLVERARKRYMAQLPRYDARKVRYRGKTRPGASRGIGRRIDKEVAHIVHCLGGPPPGILDGEIVPGLWTQGGAPLKSARCGTCGLSGKGYTYSKPRWHKWTLAYMRDVVSQGITLVHSQAVVCSPSQRLATEVDDVGVLPSGEVVAIERKSGYTSLSGRPPSKGTKWYNELGLRIHNTDFSLHRLQGALGGALAREWWGCKEQVRSVVVYVSGKVKARLPHNPSLRCTWVYEDKVGKDECITPHATRLVRGL